MSEPFLGEIRMVGFNFAPNGWLSCNGQTLSIAQNSALFALLGVTFGGDGVTTFKLPDYQGRSPVGMGNGVGLSPIVQGEISGTENVTLTGNQMPMHTHTATFQGSTSVAVSIPVGTTSTSAMVTPTSGGTSYLTSAGVAIGRDAAAINGLYTDTAPASPAQLGGITAPATATGSVIVAPTGGSQPIPVRNPFLGTNFIIATEGIFPSRP